ncbi:hypothetical protein HY251_10175 [bacterium]|nr:hypothetical protein [bacterium]
MALGYYWSILLMVSMPFLLLGGGSLLIWRELRKARKAAEIQASTLDTAQPTCDPAPLKAARGEFASGSFTPAPSAPREGVRETVS